MAVERLPPVGVPPASTPSASTPAVRDARALQKAFFDAALGKVPATPKAAPPVQAAPIPVETRPVSDAVEPGRGYRPGSLLDIKI